jgi:hypothetical protein
MINTGQTPLSEERTYGSGPFEHRAGWTPQCHPRDGGITAQKEGVMLWTVAVILLVLWVLGMGTSYTAGGLVHLLLVVAAVVVVFQFLGGRRSV